MSTKIVDIALAFANRVREDCPADNLLYQPTNDNNWFFRMLIFADAVLAEERFRLNGQGVIIPTAGAGIENSYTKDGTINPILIQDDDPNELFASP